MIIVTNNSGGITGRDINSNVIVSRQAMVIPRDRRWFCPSTVVITATVVSATTGVTEATIRTTAFATVSVVIVTVITTFLIVVVVGARFYVFFIRQWVVIFGIRWR